MMKSMKCFILTAMISLTACGESSLRSTLPTSYEGIIGGKYIIQHFGDSVNRIHFITKKQKIDGKTYNVTYLGSNTDSLLYIKNKDEYDTYRYDFRLNTWKSTAAYDNNLEIIHNYLMHLNDLKLEKNEIIEKNVTAENVIRYTYERKGKQNYVVVSKDKYHVCLDCDDLEATITEYKCPAVSSIPNIDTFTF